MSTQPHNNPEHGYALRIGKNLPEHAANLAYVHTDTPEPEKNILVNDLTETIPENSLRMEEQEVLSTFLNDEGYLETPQGILELPRADVLLTNEYALDSQNTPLFYVHRSRYLFDARRGMVAHPLNGQRIGQVRLFEEYDTDEAYRFVYQSDKIQVMRQGAVQLSSQEKVKIVLEKEGSEDFLYRIYVYSNFRGDETGFELHYPYWDENGTHNHVETFNPRTVFAEQTISSNREQSQNYEAEQTEEGNYRIKLEPSDSNDFLITESHRPPHDFQFQITSHLETRFSDKNPIELNIGIVYINDTIINATRVTSALRRLVNENPYMPDYVSFRNPHRQTGFHDPSDSQYWEADLNMPTEHWLDYDVVIVTGYGDRNFSTVRESMDEFLSAGGILLFDSAGTGNQVLNPITQQGQQTFIANIAYSQSETEDNHREFTTHAAMRDRYYNVTRAERLGRIAPVIQFRGEESIEDWTVYLRHANGGPALIRKNTGSIGQLIVSNMGWMLDVLFGKEESIQFFTNFLLHCIEHRSFVSPVFNENVYHREDLYDIEYTDERGRTIYADDRSDEDSSQLVAKKMLADRVENFMRDYIPDAYRNWQSATFETNVIDSGEIALTNNGFEQTNPNGQTSWEQTETESIPGWDFVRFSGEGTQGNHSTNTFRSGRRSLHVRTIEAQGFFEHEVGLLPQGRYELTGYVRSENSQGGGMAVYNTDGELIAGGESASGQFNWRQHTVNFELDSTTGIVIRLGSHSENIDVDLYFDDIQLHTTSVIRMTPTNSGGEPLYAYATSPRGKNNQLNHYESNNIGTQLVKKDATEHLTLIVRSFVYQWFSEEVRFKKQYGNQKNTRFTISTSDREMVLGNIQQFLPALQSGAEWARKDRVYYELSLEPHENNHFVNVSMYDPSTDRYFFTPHGEWILNHEDIWWNGFDSTVQIRAELNHYHIQSSHNGYMVQQREENQIRVRSPRTADERDRWYLSIQNGSFKKQAITAKDVEDAREGYYQDYLAGEHEYQIPEYRRQSFYPRFGERLVDHELAQYLDEDTIQVQRTPLIILEEAIEKEILVPLDEERTIWDSRHILWNREELPQIYLDEHQDGNEMLLTEGFRIDYKEGKVYLDEGVSGSILASYHHDNFQIVRRKYANKQIKGELLRSRDNYTFDLEHENLTVEPAPVFYLGTRRPETRLAPSTYWVDYESGTVTFFEETRERIYADYLYFKEEELHYTDANRWNGEIKVAERISFKDEIYVSYLSEENHLEYKGYYDEELNTFMHLDLNPTAGHTFSLKQETEQGWDVQQVEGEKLLNKEIYVYLVPYKSLYYKTERFENHTVRHVFGESSWKQVKASRPDALLLSIIQVRENTDIENVVVMDARRPGGGIKESIKQEDIERRVGYTSAFWDIGSFDGMSYYKNGVSVIQLPQSVLQEYGGHFTESQVKQILEKYLALGVYPIIEYVDDSEQDYENDEAEVIEEDDGIGPDPEPLEEDEDGNPIRPAEEEDIVGQ